MFQRFMSAALCPRSRPLVRETGRGTSAQKNMYSLSHVGMFGYPRRIMIMMAFVH